MNNLAPLTDTTSRSSELQTLLATFIEEVLRYDTVDMHRLIKRENLSMPRIVALNMVSRKGSVSISDISTYLDMSLGNASVLVDKLVCHGFVTRVEDESDRRHKRVCLTDKGQTLIQEFQAIRVDSITQRMLLLPPELLDQTLSVLRNVITELPPVSTPDHSERR